MISQLEVEKLMRALKLAGGRDEDVAEMRKQKNLKDILALVRHQVLLQPFNWSVEIEPFIPAQLLELAAIHGLGGFSIKSRDTREDVLGKIDFEKVLLGSIMPGQDLTMGEEWLAQLEIIGDVLLGGSTQLSLWRNYLLEGDRSLLENAHRVFGLTRLAFLGLLLESPGGHQGTFCLYRRKHAKGRGKWRWTIYWLNQKWEAAQLAISVSSRVIEVPGLQVSA